MKTAFRLPLSGDTSPRREIRYVFFYARTRHAHPISARSDEKRSRHSRTMSCTCEAKRPPLGRKYSTQWAVPARCGGVLNAARTWQGRDLKRLGSRSRRARSGTRPAEVRRRPPRRPACQLSIGRRQSYTVAPFRCGRADLARQTAARSRVSARRRPADVAPSAPNKGVPPRLGRCNLKKDEAAK